MRNIIQDYVLTTHIKDVVAVIYIGTTPAVISKMLLHIVLMVATTTFAKITTIITITTTVTALITPTNFAKATMFTGTIPAGHNRICILPVPMA